MEIAEMFGKAKGAGFASLVTVMTVAAAVALAIVDAPDVVSVATGYVEGVIDTPDASPVARSLGVQAALFGAAIAALGERDRAEEFVSAVEMECKLRGIC